MRKLIIWLLLIFVWLSGFVSAQAFASEVQYDLNSTVRGNQQMAVEMVDLHSMNRSDDIPAKPIESIDQYLNRMRMRRDDMQYQACLERMRHNAVPAEESNTISACVPPDYSVPEFQKYSEWNGTIMGGLA